MEYLIYGRDFKWLGGGEIIMSLKQMYEKETGKKWYIDSNYTKNTSFTIASKFYVEWLESKLYGVI